MSYCQACHVQSGVGLMKIDKNEFILASVSCCSACHESETLPVTAPSMQLLVTIDLNHHCQQLLEPLLATIP